MLRLIETFDLVHMRRPDELSIQSIRPGVIWTLQRFAELPRLLLAQSRPTVAAHIVEGAHFPLLITENDQTFAHDLLHEVFSRLRDLILMPHAQPLRRKNPLLFFPKDL